jgi:pectinesterase
MIYSYFFLALVAIDLAHCAFATQRNSPPAGSLTVGSSGTYKTISAAVAAASKGVSIFVYAGTYNEAVYITVDNLKIYGQTDECAGFISRGAQDSPSMLTIPKAHHPTGRTQSP